MFDTHFDVLLCDTTESRDWHYELRYDVYCIDRAYENASAFPDKRERDNHDAESVHFLVRNRTNGQFVASMRLVVGEPSELPFWHHCQLDKPKEHAALGKSAEISRSRADHKSGKASVCRFRRKSSVMRENAAAFL